MAYGRRMMKKKGTIQTSPIVKKRNKMNECYTLGREEVERMVRETVAKQGQVDQRGVFFEQMFFFFFYE